MKAIILAMLLAVIVNCKSTSYTADIKIIKYNCLDKIKYDRYEKIFPLGAYMGYTKENLSTNSTNYVYGGFELMTYQEYMTENK